MSVVSEIKCGKCDRMYSGLRSKCPYCGTRRISRGKYADDGNNSSGKILIAILIMTVFVVATGVLLFTTEVEEPPEEIIQEEEVNGIDDGYISLPSELPVAPPVEEEPEEEEDVPEEALVVRGVRVFNGGNLFGVAVTNGPEDRDATIKVGENYTLTARVEPMGIDAEITWATSDRGVFEITPQNVDNTEASLRAVGTGTARLEVKADDISWVIIIRVQS